MGDRPTLAALLVATSVVAGFCESIILALLAEIATALVNHTSDLNINLGPIHISSSVDQLLLVGVAVALLRAALQLSLSYLPARIAADSRATLQRELFAAFTNASWSVVAGESEGTFQELATSQIIQATNGVIYASTALTAAFLFFVLVASALIIETVTAVVVMVAGLALFLVFRPLNGIGKHQAQALSSAQVDYASGIHDAVSTAEEARVFGVGAVRQKQIDILAAGVRDRFFSTQFVGRLVGGGYQALLLLLLVGGVGILHATGAAGNLASIGAVILLLVRASNSAQMVQGNYHMMLQSLPYLDRLYEAQRLYRQVRLDSGSRALTATPSIAFEGVKYSYVSGRPVLEEVTFAVEPAEAVGVVGPTGAGKSTLVQLLLRLREPDAGSYRVAGQPAMDYSPSEWAKRVSYVPQESRLIHGTVADNIRFYRNLTDDVVQHAARLAHIHEEIERWPLGYRTIVSQRANAVSGGQRQRLCLARALAGSPFMLVLDEPTSALDARSEALVQQSLAALKGELTLFVIAHRMSTLHLCDRIMVLRHGRVEAFASPEDLMETNEFYKNAVVLSQSNLSDTSSLRLTSHGRSTVAEPGLHHT
jgi:ABC-type multidrug transport system fused ATPase/permease subunit